MATHLNHLTCFGDGFPITASRMCSLWAELASRSSSLLLPNEPGIWGSTDHMQVLLWAKEAEAHSTEDAHCHSLMFPIGFQTWVVFRVRKHGFVSFCLPFTTDRNKLCRVCALHSSSSFPCPLGGHFSLSTLSLAAVLCFCMRHPSSARSKSSSFILLGLFTLIRFGN